MLSQHGSLTGAQIPPGDAWQSALVRQAATTQARTALPNAPLWAQSLPCEPQSASCVHWSAIHTLLSSTFGSPLHASVLTTGWRKHSPVVQFEEEQHWSRSEPVHVVAGVGVRAHMSNPPGTTAWQVSPSGHEKDASPGTQSPAVVVVPPEPPVPACPPEPPALLEPPEPAAPPALLAPAPPALLSLPHPTEPAAKDKPITATPIA